MSVLEIFNIITTAEHYFSKVPLERKNITAMGISMNPKLYPNLLRDEGISHNNI